MTPAEPERPDAVLALPAVLGPAAVDALCERLEGMLAGGRERVVCDAAALQRPDLAAVDVLARLQLITRGRQRDLHLVRVGERLHELLVLTGLHDIVVGSEASAGLADCPRCFLCCRCSEHTGSTIKGKGA